MVSTEVFPREGAEWTNIWITEALYYDRTRVACIGDSITFNYRPIVGNIFYPQNIMIDMLAGSRMCGDPAFYKELEMFSAPRAAISTTLFTSITVCTAAAITRSSTSTYMSRATRSA